MDDVGDDSDDDINENFCLILLSLTPLLLKVLYCICRLDTAGGGG